MKEEEILSRIIDPEAWEYFEDNEYIVKTSELSKKIDAWKQSSLLTARTYLGQRVPVAWRVKDYADGWILYQDETEARREARDMGGALLQPLYADCAS